METREHHPANDANKGFSISLGSAWIILADLIANYLVMYFTLVSNQNGNQSGIIVWNSKKQLKLEKQLPLARHQ